MKTTTPTLLTRVLRRASLVLLALLGLCASATATQYTVTGSGVIQSSDGPAYGVVGEAATFSFTYDDSTFTRTVNGGSYSDYAPAAPIPVSVIGSVSGAIAVDPITIAEAYNDPGGNFDQWNFISGGYLTQANAWTSLGFTSDPGADFAVVNAAFVGSYAAQWSPSNNISFGKNDSSVSIGNATWTVAPAGPVLTTVIDDNFDDGNIATNTLGTGHGFVNYSQSGLPTESGGFLNLDIEDSYYTRMFASNAADAVNPFATTVTTQTFSLATSRTARRTSDSGWATALPAV